MEFHQIVQEWDHFYQKLAELRSQAHLLPLDCVSLIDDAFQKISHTIDEMIVAYEDIERTNASLLQANQIADLERQRYKALFEHAPQGFLILDRAGNIQACNATACQLLHIPQELLVGQSLIGLVGEGGQQLLQAFLDPGLYQAVHKPGPSMDLHIKGSPPEEGVVLRLSEPSDPRRQPDELWAVVYGDSAYKRKEAAMLMNQERFLSLIEITPDWVWETDAQGIYTYASPKVKNILGYKPSKMIGTTLSDFRPPEERERLDPIIRQLLEAAVPVWHLENIRTHKNGKTVYLETSGMPILDPYGNFSGFRGIDRDITGRKRLEDIVRDTRRKEAKIRESKR